MANPKRILFVSSEVAPFTSSTPTAELARQLPDQLQQKRGTDVRLMMPRYGTISERKNRLHEVIRLSDTDIPMGSQTAKLDVKVASVPDTRLQVYFMDSKDYFKRKGIYTSEEGIPFEDNVERALFFGRAVFETLLKLRWAPEVIHAAGSISGLLPFLLRQKYANEELLAETRIVFTPEQVDVDTTVTSEFVEQFELDLEPALLGTSLNDVGVHYADQALFPSHLESQNGSPQLPADEAKLGPETMSCYEQLSIEVPA